MEQVKNNKSGFTLIELMIVVIIVGILAAVAVPMMSANKEKAMNSEAIASIGAVSTASRLYIAETSDTAPTLAKLITAGLFNESDLNGTYFDSGDYSFTTISTNGRVELATAIDPNTTTWTFTWNDTTHSYLSTK
jgi:prepilin-type N-terminal cleavage/methylation domain-containing protein